MLTDWHTFSRAEEIALRHILTIWGDPRHRGAEDTENERPSICGVQRHIKCNQRPPIHAGISILRQANGEGCVVT